MKNKQRKGFTLVELLAVVAILGILATAIGVFVVNYIENSKNKSSEVTLANIKTSARIYSQEKSLTWGQESEYSYACITIQELINFGYFKQSNFSDDKFNIATEYYVLIKDNNNKTIKMVDSLDTVANTYNELKDSNKCNEVATITISKPEIEKLSSTTDSVSLEFEDSELTKGGIQYTGNYGEINYTCTLANDNGTSYTESSTDNTCNFTTLKSGKYKIEVTATSSVDGQESTNNREISTKSFESPTINYDGEYNDSTCYDTKDIKIIYDDSNIREGLAEYSFSFDIINTTTDTGIISLKNFLTLTHYNGSNSKVIEEVNELKEGLPYYYTDKELSLTISEPTKIIANISDGTNEQIQKFEVLDVGDSTPTVPIIIGGSYDWTNKSKTISVSKESESICNIEKYQYYLSKNNLNTNFQEENWIDITDNGKSIDVDEIGTNYIYFRAVSENNKYKSEASNNQIIKIDKDLPQLNISDAEYINNELKDITVTISDELSGLRSGQKVYYAWSKNNTTSEGIKFEDYVATTNKDGELITKITIPASSSKKLSGTNYLWIKKASIEDEAGNINDETVSNEFSFDSVSPTISISPAIGENYVTGRAVTVTIKEEANGSGLSKDQAIYYAWSNSNDASNPPLYSNSEILTNISADNLNGTVIIPASSEKYLTGTYYLWIKDTTVKDNADNYSKQYISNAFLFDNEAPKIVDFKLEPNGSSIAATVTATDNGSGLKTISFSKDNGVIWQEVSTDSQGKASYIFSGLSSGSYNIKVKVKDKVENYIEQELSTTVLPSVIVTASDNIKSGKWHNSKAGVTLTFSLSSSANNMTFYYGTSPTKVTSKGTSVKISTQTNSTTYYVKACSTDGICTDISEYEFKLDYTAPTITAISAKNNDDGSATVTVTATDTGSGIETYSYRYKISSYTDYVSTTLNNYTHKNLSAGTYYFDSKVTDNAGNYSNKVSSSTKITVPTYYYWLKYNYSKAYYTIDYTAKGVLAFHTQSSSDRIYHSSTSYSNPGTVKNSYFIFDVNYQTSTRLCDISDCTEADIVNKWIMGGNGKNESGMKLTASDILINSNKTLYNFQQYYNYSGNTTSPVTVYCESFASNFQPGDTYLAKGLDNIIFACQYNAVAKSSKTLQYIPGSTCYGIVESTTSSAYPTNGYQGGYYYMTVDSANSSCY